MTGPWWSDDDQLTAALGEAISSASDMPAELVEIGKAAYLWRGVGAELATLIYDSVTERDEDLLALARAEPTNLRYLTFTSEDLTIELEVTQDGLIGQIVPPQPGRLQARSADGEVTDAPINEVGGFSLRPIPRGTFRLYFQTEAGGISSPDHSCSLARRVTKTCCRRQPLPVIFVRKSQRLYQTRISPPLYSKDHLFPGVKL